MQLSSSSRISASQSGLQKLKDARDAQRSDEGKRLTDYRLAEKSHVSESSVKRFFQGKRVYSDIAKAITEALGLKLADIIDISEDEPTEINSEIAQKLLIAHRQVCQAMLTEKQGLTTNLLTFGNGTNFERNKVYVPLGLVERRRQAKRPDIFSPEQGSNLYEPTEYEVTKKFENSEFFEEVIRQGITPKSKGKRIAIIGEPGAGKTTLLQQIADRVFDETEQDVAIWVSLADLQGRTLEDYLLDVWLKDALKITRVTAEMENALAELFNRGKVWLLLDGVDEMTVDNPLQVIASQVRSWISSAQIILTCRLNVWDASKNALENFDVYRNLDFSEPQRNEFIKRWFANCPELGTLLKSELDKSGKERIRDLIKNPLRLTLLCYSWQRRQGELPDTKAELYKWFVETFYEWKEWKPDPFSTKSEAKEALNKVLGELAKEAIDRSSSRFRLTLSQVCKVLGEIDTPLFELATQIGWLNRVGVAEENPDEPVYAFLHPSFQEYFAACVIDDWDYFLPRDHDNDNPKPVEGKIYRAFASQWKEVILLWLGRSYEEVPKEQKEKFIQALIEFEDKCWDLYWYRALFLAAAGIAEFKDSIYADWIVETLIECSAEIYNDTAIERTVSITALMTILETERTKAIKALINLDYEILDENVRLEIFNILIEIGTSNPEVIAALTELMQNSQNLELRQEAAFCLFEIDPNRQKAINFLTQDLLNDTLNELLRVRAASLLGEIDQGKQNAINFLTNLLSRNSNYSLNAAHTLGRIDPGNPYAVKILTGLLNTDKGDSLIFIRLLAAGCLVEIAPDNLDGIRVLREFLAPSLDNWARMLAASYLGENQQLNTEVKKEVIKVLIEIICEPTEIRPDLRDLRLADRGIKILLEIAPEIVEIFANKIGEHIKRKIDIPLIFYNIQTIKKSLYKNRIYDIKENYYNAAWEYAQSMPYSDFYKAWHSKLKDPVDNCFYEGEIKVIENQFINIPSQLQPTNKTYPIFINAQALAGETDPIAIAQALCNRIYRSVFGDDSDIPEVSNAFQLERSLSPIKKHLQKPQLALILDKWEPNEIAIAFCHKLTDVLDIAFITNQPLEPPLKGFPPNQPNLLSAIQSWLG